MKAIVLAAGEGIRMRPLTLENPKPMLKVGGKPLIHRLIENFPPSVQEIIVVIGYLGEKIKDYLGNEFLGKKVAYVWQKEKMGTFHALELCKKLLKNEEMFGVFWADDIVDKETIAECLSENLAITISEAENPRLFGVVTIDGNGNIKEIVEKPENPQSNFVIANGYFLNKKILNYKPPRHQNGEYYLATAAANMLKEHPFRAVKARLWIPIGTPEDLEKAEKLLSG